ncbi:MAG TPA: pseudouridine synthase [Methanocorpusculum sp.]|nr:pseudouridine synthase [Methanocorpusculum sp.]HJJ59747.1 pseudouridine synthase [Methanocorpusculum sp.]
MISSEELTNLSKSRLLRVRRIADYQFGRGAGNALFPDDVTFSYSNTKRVRYVSLGRERLVTVRANDGRLTLGFSGAKRLHEYFPAPKNRVVVIDDAAPFVADWKNAMAKHVIFADESILAEDEVFITDESDNLLATGMAVLSGCEMKGVNYGTAVKTRQGANKK